MGSQCCKCASEKNKRAIASTTSGGSGTRGGSGSAIEGERYIVDGSSLRLRGAQLDDADLYSAVAVNAAGESSIEFHLDVHAAPGDVPRFIRRLNDLAVKVGTRTRLLVEIRSTTDVKTVWYREDREIPPSDRHNFLHEGSFFCLDVAPVTLEDSGLWSCVAHNVNGRSSCSCRLNVLVPKAYKKPEFLEELKAVLTEGGTVSLECKVVGVPTPHLRWFKDGEQIKAGDVFALSADPSDPTTLGTYTCEATNCMGRAVSSSRVHVNAVNGGKHIESLLPSGPVPKFTENLQNDKVKIGGSMILQCKVEVPPWPSKISWFNSQGEVEEGGRYHLMADGLGTYSCAVDPVEVVDQGQWKCVATSELGLKSITACNISVSFPKNYRAPRFLESLRAVLTEEGLVSFECKVVGYPTPHLQWFKDGQELKPGDVYQLTGTNSLGSYCCIARNCMGEAKSTAELTVEDIQSQLSEDEKLQLADRVASGQDKQPPRFLIGLKSNQANINEPFRFSVQVTVNPEPVVTWYKDDEEVLGSERVSLLKETHGICYLSFSRLEFSDQAEWKCVATNDYGQSVTSCFLKLNIPKHFKKPRFLECLRAVLSEEGAVNLECKVIGVPQPTLKWYKDGRELKPGDIHKIISGEDGTCCLGVYTCEASNCMGTTSSSASLLGFEERAAIQQEAARKAQEAMLPALTRQPSLSTIQEERTSQLQEVSFSFDGKEVSVSLYETPDLTEEEALQIVEMYAEELSEHVSEHNVVELPPMRFVKETSTSGHILMEAVVIDVSPEYYASAEDDMRTDADLDEFSISEEPVVHVPNVFTHDDIPYDKINSEFLEQSLAPISALSETDKNIKSKKLIKKESQSKDKDRDSDKSSSGPYSDAFASEKETKSQKDSFASAIGSPERDVSFDFKQHIELETKSSPAVMETNQDLTSKRKAEEGPAKVKRSKSRSKSKEKEALVKRSVSRSVSKDGSSDESRLSDGKIKKKHQKHERRKSKSESEMEDDSLQEFERRKALQSSEKYFEPEDSTSPEIRKKNGKIKSTDSEREDDSLVEFESRKVKESASGTELKRSRSRDQAQKRAMKKRGSTDSSSKEDDSLVEYEKRKTLSTGTTSIKTSRSKKGGLNKKRSSESSEKEDDPHKEDVEKKRKKKGLKQITTVSGKETTPETGVEVIQSSETDSVGRGIILEAFARVESRDDGDETTEFDTAEDSAYDKSEMSVLESLTQSLHEIQKGLAMVEEQVISESSEEPETAKSSLSVIESLVQPINELKKSIEVVEKQIEEESIFGEYSPSKAGLTILETLAQPVQEFERSLALVEQQTLIEGLEESLLERTSQSILDRVAQPLQEFHRDIALIQQQAVVEMTTDPYSDILHSFKPPIVEVQGGILQSEKDFTSKLEDLSEITTIVQPTYADVVDELQKSLTQIVEQSIFDSTNVDSMAESIPVTIVEMEKDVQEKEKFIQELKIVEATAKNETNLYKDRLDKCIKLINEKIINSADEELQHILKSLSNFEQPLRSLENITNKCIADISENSSSTQWDFRPSSKQEMIQSLTRPFQVLNESISILEKTAETENVNETRGIGIASLYKLAIPIDELNTTIKLVENLSSHTAIEFLSPPVENMLSALSTISHELSKEDFIENIPTDGENVIKSLDDSLEIMVNCINSIEKYSPESIIIFQKEKGGTSLYSLIKPLEEFQKNLHTLLSEISDKEKINKLSTTEIYHIGQELGKPLHAIRIELSIIKHQIELDEYSSFSLQPSDIISEGNTTMSNLLEPVENVQKSVSTFYESIVSRTPEEPIHIRYILHGLKNLIQPVNSLCSGIMKTEEQILQDVPSLSEPSLGLRIVTQSVHELRDSIESIKHQSHEILAQPEIIIISDILSTLSFPLVQVEDGLVSISDKVHEEDKTVLNINLLKTMAEPFKELQKALININNKFSNENISEAVLFELKQPIQELQRSILVIQDQVSFEYGDEPTPIESNIVTLQSLIQPMKTLKRHFINIQKLIAEQNKSKEIQIAQKIVGISKVIHKLQLKVSSLMVQQSYFRISKHTGHLELLPALQYLVQFLNDFERALNHTEQYIARKENININRVKEKLLNNVQYLKSDMVNLHKKLNNLKDLSPSDCESTEILTKAIDEFTVALEDECTLLSQLALDDATVIICLESHFDSFIEHINNLNSKLLLVESKIRPFVIDEDLTKEIKEEKVFPQELAQPLKVLEVTTNALQSKLCSIMNLAEGKIENTSRNAVVHVVENMIQNVENLKKDICDAKQETELLVLKEVVDQKVSKSDEIKEQIIVLKNEIQHGNISEIISNKILQSVENSLDNITECKTVISNKIDELLIPEVILHPEIVDDKEVPATEKIAPKEIPAEDLILGSLNMINEDIKENIVSSTVKESPASFVKESADQINNVITGINELSSQLFVSKENKEDSEQGKEESLKCLDTICDDLLKLKHKVVLKSVDVEIKKVIVERLEQLQNAVISVREEIIEKPSSDISVLDQLLEPLKEFSKVISYEQRAQADVEMYEGLLTEVITPSETVEERSLKILEEFAKASTDLELGLMKVEHIALNTSDQNKGKPINVEPLIQPIQLLSEKVALVEEMVSETSEYLGEQTSLSLSMLKTLAQPIKEIQNNILNIQQQTLETTEKGEVGLVILEAIAKPIRELRTGIALIQEQAVVMEADAITISETTKDFPMEEIATPLQELKNVLNSIIEQQAIIFEPIADPLSEKETLSELQTIATPIKELQKQLAEIETQQILEGGIDELFIKETLVEMAKPIVELQRAIATIEKQEALEIVEKDYSDKQTETLKRLAKPLLEVSRGIACITEYQILDDVVTKSTLSDVPTLASPTDISLEAAVEVHQPIILECNSSLSLPSLEKEAKAKISADDIKTIAAVNEEQVHEARGETIADINSEPMTKTADETTEPTNVEVVSSQPLALVDEDKLQVEDLKKKNVSEKETSMLEKLPITESQQILKDSGNISQIDKVELTSTAVKDSSINKKKEEISKEVIKQAVASEEQTSHSCVESLKEENEQLVKAEVELQPSIDVAVQENTQTFSSADQLKTFKEILEERVDSGKDAVELKTNISVETGNIAVTSTELIVLESESKLQKEEVQAEQVSGKLVSLEKQLPLIDRQQVLEDSGEIDKPDKVEVASAAVKDVAFRQIAVTEEQKSLSGIESLKEDSKRLVKAEVVATLAEAAILEDQQTLSTIDQLKTEDNLSSKALLTLSALKVIEQIQQLNQQEEAETLSDADTLTSTTLAAECDVTPYGTALVLPQADVLEAKNIHSEESKSHEVIIAEENEKFVKSESLKSDKELEKKERVGIKQETSEKDKNKTTDTENEASVMVDKTETKKPINKDNENNIEEKTHETDRATKTDEKNQLKDKKVAPENEEQPVTDKREKSTKTSEKEKVLVEGKELDLKKPTDSDLDLTIGDKKSELKQKTKDIKHDKQQEKDKNELKSDATVEDKTTEIIEKGKSENVSQGKKQEEKSKLENISKEKREIEEEKDKLQNISQEKEEEKDKIEMKSQRLKGKKEENSMLQTITQEEREKQEEKDEFEQVSKEKKEKDKTQKMTEEKTTEEEENSKLHKVLQESKETKEEKVKLGKISQEKKAREEELITLEKNTSKDKEEKEKLVKSSQEKQEKEREKDNLQKSSQEKKEINEEKHKLEKISQECKETKDEKDKLQKISHEKKDREEKLIALEKISQEDTEVKEKVEKISQEKEREKDTLQKSSQEKKEIDEENYKLEKISQEKEEEKSKLEKFSKERKEKLLKTSKEEKEEEGEKIKLEKMSQEEKEKQVQKDRLQKTSKENKEKEMLEKISKENKEEEVDKSKLDKNSEGSLEKQEEKDKLQTISHGKEKEKMKTEKISPEGKEKLKENENKNKLQNVSEEKKEKVTTQTDEGVEEQAIVEHIKPSETSELENVKLDRKVTGELETVKSKLEEVKKILRHDKEENLAELKIEKEIMQEENHIKLEKPVEAKINEDEKTLEHKLQEKETEMVQIKCDKKEKEKDKIKTEKNDSAEDKKSADVKHPQIDEKIETKKESDKDKKLDEVNIPDHQLTEKDSDETTSKTEIIAVKPEIKEIKSTELEDIDKPEGKNKEIEDKKGNTVKDKSQKVSQQETNAESKEKLSREKEDKINTEKLLKKKEEEMKQVISEEIKESKYTVEATAKDGTQESQKENATDQKNQEKRHEMLQAKENEDVKEKSKSTFDKTVDIKKKKSIEAFEKKDDDETSKEKNELFSAETEHLQLEEKQAKAESDGKTSMGDKETVKRTLNKNDLDKTIEVQDKSMTQQESKDKKSVKPLEKGTEEEKKDKLKEENKDEMLQKKESDEMDVKILGTQTETKKDGKSQEKELMSSEIKSENALEKDKKLAEKITPDNKQSTKKDLDKTTVNDKQTDEKQETKKTEPDEPEKRKKVGEKGKQEEKIQKEEGDKNVKLLKETDNADKFVKENCDHTEKLSEEKDEKIKNNLLDSTKCMEPDKGSVIEVASSEEVIEKEVRAEGFKNEVDTEIHQIPCNKDKTLVEQKNKGTHSEQEQAKDNKNTEENIVTKIDKVCTKDQKIKEDGTEKRKMSSADAKQLDVEKKKSQTGSEQILLEDSKTSIKKPTDKGLEKVTAVKKGKDVEPDSKDQNKKQEKREKVKADKVTEKTEAAKPISNKLDHENKEKLSKDNEDELKTHTLEDKKDENAKKIELIKEEFSGEIIENQNKDVFKTVEENKIQQKEKDVQLLKQEKPQELVQSNDAKSAKENRETTIDTKGSTKEVNTEDRKSANISEPSDKKDKEKPISDKMETSLTKAVKQCDEVHKQKLTTEIAEQNLGNDKQIKEQADENRKGELQKKIETKGNDEIKEEENLQKKSEVKEKAKKKVDKKIVEIDKVKEKSGNKAEIKTEEKSGEVKDTKEDIKQKSKITEQQVKGTVEKQENKENLQQKDENLEKQLLKTEKIDENVVLHQSFNEKQNLSHDSIKESKRSLTNGIDSGSESLQDGGRAPILTKSESLMEKKMNKTTEKLDSRKEIKSKITERKRSKEEIKIISQENGEAKTENHTDTSKQKYLEDKEVVKYEKADVIKTERDYKTVSISEEEKYNKSNDYRSVQIKTSSNDKELDRSKRSKSEDHQMWVSSISEPKIKRYQDDSSSSESAAQPPKQTWTRRESKVKPYFCGRLMDRTSPQGGRVKMSCSFIGNPEPKVKWLRDGLPLLYSASDPMVDRYDTKVNNGIATLEIYSASPGDCGRYTCVASNPFGEATTTATLRIFTPFEPTTTLPTFKSRIQDQYKFNDDQLVLECRVTGQPHPTTTWLKDGKEIPARGRYQHSEMTNGTSQLIICGPEPSDSGFYTCRAQNIISTEQISDLVTFQGRAHYSTEKEHERSSKFSKYDNRRPQVINLMTDHVVPAGGMLALHVQVKGSPQPQIKWFRGSEPVEKKAVTLHEGGLYSLILPDVAPEEAGLYTCRASNVYGHTDASAHVQILTKSCKLKGKPAMFTKRPATRLTVAEGEDICVSLRLTGDPKPRVTWMKGLKDMNGCGRSMKEYVGDIVQLTLKRATQWDAGTYFIVAKNIYGSDRAFFTVYVRQRARSLTPLSWDATDTDLLLKDIHEMVQSSLKDVPGPVDSEPVVTDGGRTWLTLSWSKPRHQGAAPILAYKVEAWQLGEDGGARWDELGVTPISTFDAFELKPGSSYKFRVTARNRFGWGEPTVTREPIIAGCQHLRPEIITDLPGQLKALQSANLTLQCEIRGEPQPDIRWFLDGREVAVSRSKDDRLSVKTNGELCSLLIRDLCPEDSGRYICEATNKLGRASTFVRLVVVQEPRLLKAADQLKRIQDGDEIELTTIESPPQFCLRLRDRRVQTSYPVRLTCQVVGYPTPNISWFKEGQQINEDDRHSFWSEEHFQTLEISRARTEDSGQYSVTAQNEHGSVSCRCQLVVDKGIKDYVSPGFLYGVDDVVTINEGKELRLRAQVEAYPAVGITWHRDGIRLRQSRRLVITLDKEGRTELSLADVTPRDAGTYCCTAVNEVGHAETSCQVIVQPRSGGTAQSSVMPPLLSSTTNSDLPYTKPPMFLTKPRSTSAVEGDTVVIMCEVLGDPKPEVMWLRDWLKPGYYRDAPQFVCSNDGPQFRLEIPHVKLDFTGAYCVLARNEHGEVRAVISLQVFARGQGIEGDMNSGQVGVKQSNIQTLPEIVRELKDIRCCDGDSVTLECKIYAQPLPETRWLKDGKILPMGGDISNELDGDIARLMIKKVYPEDEGEYTCMAYNELGRALTSACLIVDVPEEKEVMVSRQLVKPPGFLSTPSTPSTTPSRSISPGIQVSRDFTTPAGLNTTRPRRQKLSSPKFYAVPHNRVAEQGETVRFQCSVAGHPIPWASWDKDGRIVTPSARYSILEKDDLRMLQIKEVTEEDAGLYRITLENDYGSVEATARLEVIAHRGSKAKGLRAWSASRASPTFGRRLVGSAARVGGTFTLTCDVQASPSPVITWYRNGEVVVRSERITPLWDGRTARLKLRDLENDDAGVYTCVAENELGRTRCSAELLVLDVTDPSDADLKPPVFVNGLPELSPATEGQPFELQVKLLGTQPLEVVWVKDDVELPDCMDFRYVDYGDGIFGLRIADVFTADAGIYACEAFNPHGDAITSGRLEVTEATDLSENRKKQLYFTKTPTPLDVEPGNSASFCARLHSPVDMPMHIIWSVAGQPVNGNCGRFRVEQDGDSTVLRINPVTSEDIGAVNCRAHICSDGHREPTTRCSKCYVVSCTSRLAITSENCEGRPAILLQGPEDTTALRGQKVVLKAVFCGHPQPTVRWLKAGRELSSRGCMQIITISDSENIKGESSLILDPVSSDDSGKYVVSVENCLGADCHFASVAVEGPPDPPAGRPSATAMDDNSVSITWSSPPYDGGCMVTGYRIEMKNCNDSDWTVVADKCHSLSHVVHALTLGQHYAFRIRAENVHGASHPSIETLPVLVGRQLQVSGHEDDSNEVIDCKPVDVQPGEEFVSRFEVLEELGKGRYGVVHRVIDRKAGCNMAAKFVRCIKKQDREKVREEIGIMNCLRHPKLLQLTAAYENAREVIMVMEYITGGELFERVVADDFILTERDCILFMRQICEGVEYMHQNSIVHLDLKPENIMCYTRTSHQIKVIDFGLAQKLSPDTTLRALFGTPEFIPPEIINYEPIGIESDMWSLGVICYVLLSGLSPFMGDNDAETFANITRADFDFDDEAFDAISQDAKDFISGLLVKRKEKRMSASQCLQHKWMSQCDTDMSCVKISTDKLKKFIIRRKWQKTGNAIRALGRMATLSAASRRNSSSPRPSLSGGPGSPRSRMSSLTSSDDQSQCTNMANDAVKQTRLAQSNRRQVA